MEANKNNQTRRAEVVAVCKSGQTGERKSVVDEGKLIEGYGLEGDAHGGDWHRQVSLLAQESIDKMKAQGLQVSPGDFAENITTKNLDLIALPIGTRFTIGDTVELTVTQIGKECHDRCAIYQQAGDCVMPREGIFAKIEKGGKIKPGDQIRVLT
ncbi:MOSC domain-containing protein [Natranaerobius thermophilus]|uniref:MOSC domain containing protein n=1 Tax=Natranaerobius thermophilus (strain ATCC BAA-1301 / DSM 18059 / JW/NM-WN-LF) TaxID=457570 RepID=B2A244_NATTJ|nr:MOSC domain-containing protein [Natranaerobius thermophilus]ACB84849.1 MOSC domain containing protein [Natranaerobius thermophilus JW/NM-WN-LF]